MVVWHKLFAVTTLILFVDAGNLTIDQKLVFDSLPSDDVRLRREAWAADDFAAKPDTQLRAFKSDSQKTGSMMMSQQPLNGYGSAFWNGYNTDNQPDMQAWQSQLGSTGSSSDQYGSASYPQSYGTMPASGNPNSPYAGYLEKQIASYPVMIYTLNECIPCQRAKQLIATHYPDARAHYLELSGNESWQQQLQMDLQYLTGANTFPFIFVSGNYIGGFSELYELHENGQLRRLLNQSLAKGIPK